MNKFYLKIRSFFKLWFEYGFSLMFTDLCLELIGKISRYSKLWKQLYRRKYRLIMDYLISHYGTYAKLENNQNIGKSKIGSTCPIYVYWDQGFDDAPAVVKACLRNIKRFAMKHPVIELERKNFAEYVEIPDYILEKLDNGTISRTHFSDILRTALLAEQTCIWIDATLFTTSSASIIECENYQFYTIKHQQFSDFHIGKGNWSGFMLASSVDNGFFKILRGLFYEYWKQEKALIDYLLIDCFIELIEAENPAYKELIERVPVNNTGVFELMKMVNDDYRSSTYKNIISSNSFHKLTYKIAINETDSNTIYRYWEPFTWNHFSFIHNV